jgi:hypothetical protein
LPADAKPYTYYLELAADAADEFMKSSGYALYTAETPATNYVNLFNKHSVVEGTNKEIILARNYDIQYGVVHSANASYQSATLGRPGLTRKLVASYLMKDGSRFTDKAGWQTMTFVEETKDRDPRLAQSIRTPGYCRLNTTTPVAPNLGYTVTGYAPIKYLTTAAYNAYNKAEIDLILFRSAEVYLNYAEAKAELGTLTQDDLDMSVNKLRERVGMPAMNMAEANAKPDPFLKAPASGENTWGGFSKVATGGNEGVILEIRRERMVELIQEGHRYYDIIRWAEGKIFESPLYGIYVPQPENGKVIFDFNGDGTNDYCVYQTDKPSDKVTVYQKAQADVILSKESYGYIQMHKGMGKWDEERDYLKPIPSEERSLNRNLTQNPGWKDGLDF